MSDILRMVSEVDRREWRLAARFFLCCLWKAVAFTRRATARAKFGSLLIGLLLLAFPAVSKLLDSIGSRYALELPPWIYRALFGVFLTVIMISFFKEVWSEFRHVENERDVLRGQVHGRLVLRAPSHTNIQDLRYEPWPNDESEALVGWSVLFSSMILVNQSDAVARLSIQCWARIAGEDVRFPLEPRNPSKEKTLELAPRKSAEISLRGEVRRMRPESAEAPQFEILRIEVENLAMPGAPPQVVMVPPHQPFPPPKAPPPPTHSPRQSG